MILCDTNILVEFYKNNTNVIQEFRKIGYRHLAICPITKGELYFGALNKEELSKIKKHTALLQEVPLDFLISKKFLALMENYSLSHKLSLPDAIIAATAIVHNIRLYTFNTKDFKFINGLNLYNHI